MRILYHHRTQAEDGQAVHIRALQRAFREQGCEVQEFALVARSQARSQGRTAGGAPRSRFAWVARLPAWARELLEYGYAPAVRGRLLAAARSFGPDFIYERYAFGNTAGLRAARALGVPLVLEVNSPMVLELSRTRGLAFERLARRIERRIFAGADLLCAVSGVLRDIVVAEGARPERVIVTPNGVHLGEYDPRPSSALRAASRADLGVAGAADELLLGFVGFYRDWHRLDLAAAALARPRLAAARLVLVGEGPARASIEAAARAAGTLDRVHFAGPRPHGEIPRLLAAFDVALMPAINAYASPLKLHEYMAAGLASVVPDQPNLREVLAHERDALFYDPASADGLALALERLAGDAALRARLGQAARRTVEARDLTWDGNARRVLDAVRTLPVRERGAHGGRTP